MTERNGFCPLDCPDACSLVFDVVDGRVRSVDGDLRNPLTKGVICAKVRGLPEHMYGEHRVLRPLVRTGEKGASEFRATGWDEALDLVARRLLEVVELHGGAAVLPVSYGGSNGLLTQDTTDARFFRRLGASRLARTVCAAPTTSVATAMYGKMAGVALTDYVDARLIVIWGANPEVSGMHLVPVIRAARERGARVVVVDPRRTKLARQADLHLALRPGADLPVALSIADRMFRAGTADLDFLSRHAEGVETFRERASSWSIERAADVAGLAASDIETLARWYSETDPAVIRCGWGLERNRNGGSAVAAVLALPAVGGKFGVRGGGYTLSNSRAFEWSPADVVREVEPDTRVVNMNRVGESLLTLRDPAIHALFVYNCNPLMTLPEQEKVRAGLARDDLFTVVFDAVRTDTAAWADVVLPATVFPEHAELSTGYGAAVLQRSEPAVIATGDARPNYDVFADLCRRAGVARDDEPETASDLAAAILGDDPPAQNSDGIAFPERGFAPVQFVDVIPRTADGRAVLVPPDLDAECRGGLYTWNEDPGTERYPLALISPATKHTTNSTFGQSRTRQVALQMHPRDATARSLDDGEAVRVHNASGEVHCLVEVTERTRPGVVVLPKGLWAHNTLNGATSNAVTPDSLTDIGGGACFNDARVEIERLAPGDS